MSDNPLDRLRPAAHFLRKLRALKPGETLTIGKSELLDMELPVDPMTRMDDADIAEWFRVRCDFRCDAWRSGTSPEWRFRHYKRT